MPRRFAIIWFLVDTCNDEVLFKLFIVIEVVPIFAAVVVWKPLIMNVELSEFFNKLPLYEISTPGICEVVSSLILIPLGNWIVKLLIILLNV